MSLKLFLLNTFGGIKPTSKIEAEKESLLKDYQVFNQVEKSDELDEFMALEGKVSSDSFKNMKSELTTLKFKGSPEENQLKQFNKLEKNKRLRKYYATTDSAELKRYESLKEGTQLDRYFELEKLVRQGLDKSDEKTNELKAEFKQLKSSSDVRFFYKYPKSSVFKNYLRMQNSEEKRKFEELKVVVNSEDFKERKTYLEDPRKWEKTAEYLDEQRYLELKNKQEINLYFKYKDSSAFDFFRDWKVVFEDRFEANALDSTKWKTINYWADKTVGKNFSQDGDLHAFADGKNTQLNTGRLQLQVKKDKINSMVWNPELGFLEREFDYSTDILTTGGLFEAQYGILEAKVKFDPNKNFQDVFYLIGEDQSLRVNFLEQGAKTQIGISLSGSLNNRGHVFSLSGLSAGKTYILKMEWEKGKISWKVNDKELFSVQNDVPNEPLFLNLTSFVIQETNSLPHHFEIDWIRFYQKKN